MYLALALIWAAWLVFMLLFPRQWAAIVERENAYWVSKGLLKPGTAEKFVKFEKGKGIQIFVAFTAVLFSFIDWLLSSNL